MDASTNSRRATRTWPMTPEAWSRLVDEVSRLRSDVAVMAGAEGEDGVVQLPFAQAARRLETLLDAQVRAEIVAESCCAAIGRRATVRDDLGDAMSFAIVFPGDGDPNQGWVSADSPLGAAVLGAHAGDVVEVIAPAGRWSASIVAVD